MGRLRQKLRADLEATEAERAFGTGWISGVAALALASHAQGHDAVSTDYRLGYGVGGHPVPSGYLKQFGYPFQRG